jgi:hypothetical protein
MEWFVFYGPLVIIGILVFLPARKRNDLDDPFIEQAKIDQKNADYPGCREGFMECRSQSCGCNERKLHRDFITERAKMLRDNNDNS